MGLKVLFCWSDISGYMAACWRSLAQHDNINLFVIAFQAKTETAFHENLMKGIPCKLLTLEERNTFSYIERLVLQFSPDVLVLSGWLHPPYRKLSFLSALRHVPCIMGMDTPWQDTWKQKLAPFLLSRYLQRMSKIVVTGERSWTYAKKLGVPSEKINKGLYGIDYKPLETLWQQRRNLAHLKHQSWPRSFLFLGRYSTVKGVDLLISAYQSYRQSVADPWDLICCGQGSLEYLLQDKPGIYNRGFIQPDDLPQIWQQAGIFILPSRFDPWPLALVEAGAAGLPLLCTDACGSAVEVVRQGYNGWIVATGRINSLTQALAHIHYQTEAGQLDLALWGQRSQSLAYPYSADIWAEYWLSLLNSTAKA
jgi:glycosyltransferase involved in cell wall biosynthesis